MHALILNCTLKSSSKEDPSNTEALARKAIIELESLGVTTEIIRIADYTIAHGTSSDEGKGDQWPLIFEKIKECDIFIIASPIWVGHTASTAQQVIERLDAIFHEEGLSDKNTGQYLTYNKVAGVLVTGNEDGAHAVVAHLTWALSELGFTIPPNTNAYWVGSAGPGPSYIEAGGERNLYTNKLVLYTVHNLVYFAQLLHHHPITTNLNELNEKAKSQSDSE